MAIIIIIIIIEVLSIRCRVVLIIITTKRECSRILVVLPYIILNILTSLLILVPAPEKYVVELDHDPLFNYKSRLSKAGVLKYNISRILFPRFHVNILYYGRPSR